MRAIIITFGLILAFTQVLPAQSDAVLKAIDHYNSAVEALNTNDNKTAISELSAAIALDGKFHKAIYQRGLTYIQEQKYHEGVKDLADYLALRPDEAQALYYKGYAEMQSKQNPAAIKSLTASLALDDTQEKAYYYRGYLLILQENYDNAISDMDLALANGYQSDKLWKYKAMCHYKLQEYPSAAMAYDRYLENNPSDTKAMLTRCLALYKMEDYEAYIPQMQRYLSQAQGTRDHYYSLATAHLKLEQYREAASTYEQAISIDPTYIPALKNAMYVASKLGNKTNLLRDYDRLIDAEGPQSEYYYKRAVLLMQQEDWTRAESDLTTCITQDPDHAEAYFNRASIYTTTKQYAEGCADMRKAASLGMESAYQYIPSLCKAAGN